MKEPEIKFHQSLNEYFKERIDIGIYTGKDIDVKTVKGWIIEFIMEAWQKLIKNLEISFIKRFDVVIATCNAQLTPLVTRGGVVIRLDLGREGIDYQDKEEIRSYIFHEIYHLADRLDPKFNMDYHMDAEVKQKNLGKIINAVWDLYIERRKFYIYRIRPIYCKDKKYIDTNKIEEIVQNNFLNIIRNQGGYTKIYESIFNKVWDQSNLITYRQIYDYSMKFFAKDKRLMRKDRNVIAELERLLEKYEIEIEGKRKTGILEDKTAKTYLGHANTFVRWCKGDFAPGNRKLK